MSIGKEKDQKQNENFDIHIWIFHFVNIHDPLNLHYHYSESGLRLQTGTLVNQTLSGRSNCHGFPKAYEL